MKSDMAVEKNNQDPTNFKTTFRNGTLIIYHHQLSF